MHAAQRDANWEVRRTAIQLLPSTGNAGEIKLQLALRWYSPDAHYMTRQEAIVMSDMCGAAAIPNLEQIAATDSDPELQDLAKRVLEGLKRTEERERKRAESERKRKKTAPR